MEGFRVMQLPQSRIRQMYIDQIKDIEKDLKDVTSNKVDKKSLISIQEKIDIMAKKYQENEEIGAVRYKLYELQALIHYFNDNDNDALDFINQAIETRGEKYERAEKLKAQILAKSTYVPKEISLENMTKQERRKKLIGLEGWLAFFIVGVSISTIYNALQIFSYPSVFSEMKSVRSQASGFVSAMIPALWFEIFQFAILTIIGIWLIILFAQHKRLAKKIAIVFLIANIILGTIDYGWASSIFSEYNLNFDSEMSKQSGNIGRSIIASCIWIPYFSTSKRVKKTLTR